MPAGDHIAGAPSAAADGAPVLPTYMYATQRCHAGVETLSEEKSYLQRYLRARGLDGNTADDMLGVITTRFLVRCSEGPMPEEPRAYLAAITRNAVMDHWRSAARRREIPTDCVEDLELRLGTERSAEEAFALSTQREEVRLKVMSLPYRMRQVIELVYLQDRSVDQTARTLGMSRKAVHMTCTRAVEKLRQMYANAADAAGTDC